VAAPAYDPLTVTVSLECVRGARRRNACGACRPHWPTNSGGIVDGEEALPRLSRSRRLSGGFPGDGNWPSHCRRCSETPMTSSLPVQRRNRDGTALRALFRRDEPAPPHVLLQRVISTAICRRRARVGLEWDAAHPESAADHERVLWQPAEVSRGHMTRREDPGWGNARRRSAATKTRCTSPIDAADAGLQRADLARTRGTTRSFTPRKTR